MNNFFKINALNELPLKFSIDIGLVEARLHFVNNSISLDIHGLCKAHILRAHEILRVVQAKFQNAILSKYFVSVAFTLVIFKPSLKDKMKSHNDINNFRPIAIVQMLYKFIESCLVDSIVPFSGTH